MRSKITIEVDLDASLPYFQVIVDKTSEDIRDQLIRKFREKFGCYSSWARVKFDDTAISGHFMFTIEPIRHQHLKDELKELQRITDMMDKAPFPTS